MRGVQFADAAIAPVNPYVGSAEESANAARQVAADGAQIIFLDCVGYTQAMADDVTRITGVPAITARSLAVRLVAAVA
ncbi:AroM family protein [Microbacterium sp. YY-03]|uniref:AroM family protein n=1 Tax=Microbacterium sp. YY-03 TaxID=3421636 RepID=UPI003D16D8BE